MLLLHMANKQSTQVLEPPIVHEIESHADWLELLWFDDGDDDDDNDQEEMITNDDDDDDESSSSQLQPIPMKKLPITAVTFHASWCRYCLKFLKKWNRKVVANPQLKQQLRFASVEYGANRKLCQSLNIQKLPTIQLYYGQDLFASFPCPPKEFKRVPALLSQYVTLHHDEMQRTVEAWTRNQPQAASNNGMLHNKRSNNDDQPIEISEQDDDDDPSSNLVNDNDDSATSRSSEPELFRRKRDRFLDKLKRRKR